MYSSVDLELLLLEGSDSLLILLYYFAFQVFK